MWVRFLKRRLSNNFFLPLHQHCVAHTLDLIATNEVDKAASQGPSRKLYRSAMSKCSSIWNKAHNSTLASEATEDIASKKVTEPCVTRWSSEYHAISKLIALTDDQLGQICEDLGVSSKLHPCEIAFLKKYSTVLQPLTFSIDLLQGEEVFSWLSPTIINLKSKPPEKILYLLQHSMHTSSLQSLRL